MYDLVRKIVIQGRNFFGQEAQLMFYPNGGKHLRKWTVNARDGLSTQPLLPHLLQYSKRTVCIQNGKNKLPVAEHILPLAWFVAGVHVSQVSSYPPYVMPGQLLDEKSPHSIRSSLVKGGQREWVSMGQSVEWAYPNQRGGKKSYTRIIPIKNQTLEVFVSISYPGVGSFEKTYDLEGMKEDELVRILSTQPQAVVPYPAVVRRVLSLCKWPAVNSVVWPDVSSEQAKLRTLEAWADHRFLDILGAFGALIDGYCCPAMRIESVCSGHEADVRVVQCVGRGMD